MCLIFELFLEAAMGFTQMFVTALWQTGDPTVIAKRNVCLSVYGVAAAIFLAGFVSLLLHLTGLLFFLGCVGFTMILLLIAGHLADEVEKLVLQQKNHSHKTESEEL